MKRLLAAIAVIVLSLAPVCSAVDATQEKLSKEHQAAFDASLALYGIMNVPEVPNQGGMKMSINQSRFMCSTTVIGEEFLANKEAGKHDYLLLTAGHCIVGDSLPAGLTFGVAEVIEEVPQLQMVDVIRAQNDSAYDFAILHLRTAKTYPIIEIETKNAPQIEDKVYSVNFSLGIAKQVALGMVASGVMTTQTPDCDICKGRFMVHIFAAGGASGSSIIDAKSNKIIGIVEFGFPGTTTGSGCETMTSLMTWLKTPVATKIASPKA